MHTPYLSVSVHSKRKIYETCRQILKTFTHRSVPISIQRRVRFWLSQCGKHPSKQPYHTYIIYIHYSIDADISFYLIEFYLICIMYIDVFKYLFTSFIPICIGFYGIQYFALYLLENIKQKIGWYALTAFSVMGCVCLACL